MKRGSSLIKASRSWRFVVMTAAGGFNIGVVVY